MPLPGMDYSAFATPVGGVGTMPAQSSTPAHDVVTQDASAAYAKQLEDLVSQPGSISRLIAHITQQDAINAPTRDAIRKEVDKIQLSGQELIDAMATMGASKAKTLDAEQQSKLAQEKLAHQRARQVGIDMNDPANDRLAKMTAELQSQQDAAVASQHKIQQLDSVGFAANPIQWFMNQYSIESEKETLARTSGMANQLAGQLTQMHNLAQENVQTITALKIAKTDGELLAAKEDAARLASADLARAKLSTSGSVIQGLSHVLAANEQEQSVMWKALATARDEKQRDRDHAKDAMQLEMLRLQLGKLGDEVADKKAVIKDMKQFAVNALGADPRQVDAMPNEAVLGNKPLQEAYFAKKGATGPQGPKSALDSIEANSTPDSIFQNTRPAHWIKEKLSTLQATLPPELNKLGPNAEKAQTEYFDQALVAAAKAELTGDHDNSTLYRIPTVGELRQLEAVKNTNLFHKYVSKAPDSARYSFKQLIGFAVADPVIKTDPNARARLVKDITTIAITVNNYADVGYFFEKYGLPTPVSFKAGGGYLVIPTELLEAANANTPASLKRRAFDLTKPTDAQLLVSLATASTQSGLFSLEMLNFGGKDFGGSLRAVDPIQQKSTGQQPPKKK